MREKISVTFIMLMLLCLVNSSYAATPHVYGTFVLFEVDEEWAEMKVQEKQKGVQEAKAVIDAYKDRVAVDAYWTLGLTNASHFLLRLHSPELSQNQNFLTKLMASGLGRKLRITFTISGVTKGLNYAPQFPKLLEQLKAAKYEGEPPTYAIMIPTRKDAAWWNLPKEERVAMMKVHTVPTLPYLTTVKRKLYHATGLADADFITFFQTNTLVDFNNLLIALQMVRENKHNVRLGSPTILGTIRGMDEFLTLLAR